MRQDAAKHLELVVQGYNKLFEPEDPKSFDASNRLIRCEDSSIDTSDVGGNRVVGDGGGSIS